MRDSNIVGNVENLRYFKKLIENKKLSHAYMIIGPEKSGKLLLTKNILSMLLFNDNDIDRLFKEECPDVIIIDKEIGKKSIGIDQIRDYLKDISLTPFEFSFKAYIIKNADSMTIQAQNSLLKAIEEPQNNVYFFLLTTNSSLLLQTISSRVQKIYVDLFNKEKIYDILIDKYSSEYKDRIEFASKFSNGSLGKAVSLVNEDNYEYQIYNNVLSILNNLLKKGVDYNYFQLLNDLNQCFYNKKDKSDNKAKFYIMLNYFNLAFRDIITAKVSTNNSYLFFSESNIMEFLFKFSVNNISRVIDVISDLQYKQRYNYNLLLASKVFALELWYNL